MTRIRTAIFGGSFNPIHNGHVALARQIVQDKLADEVWLLISPQNPLKKQKDLLNENSRLRLAESALANDPKITASDFEFHLPRPSYTWNTLCELSKAYPDREFILLIGADNWLIFNNWAHYEDIVKNYPILIYPREGYDINKSELPASVHFIDAPLFTYSSTDVRRVLADYKKMVPPAILADLLKEPDFP